MAACGLSGSAHAASPCTSIDADLDRLACYDRESGRTPVTAVKTAAETESAWTVTTNVSQFTDEKQVYLAVQSKGTVSCSWNRQSPVIVTIRCQENTTAAYVSSDCHMVSSPYNTYGNIDYRVDAEPSRTISMVESTDNKSLGLWNGGKAIPFIKQLVGRKKMILRFTPFSDSPVAAEFDISGLEKVIGPLQQECGWK